MLANATGRLDMLYDSLIAPFSEFAFMRRALVGGLVLSLSAAPVGVFLMLRRMSLIGDAMAHAILPGAAIGFLFGGLSMAMMTLGGLVAGFSVALAAGLVSRTSLVKEDMALAAFYLTSLALGVLILSASETKIDLIAMLFGSILALDGATLILIASVATLTLSGLAIGYRGLVLDCLDPGFAAGLSRRGWMFHLGFLTLVVCNLVAGFHALGTLLVVGIMMVPAGIARLWRDDVGGMIAISIAAAMLSTLVGLILSFHFGLASGPAIIVVAGVFYAASLLAGPHGVLRPFLPKPHLEA